MSLLTSNTNEENSSETVGAAASGVSGKSSKRRMGACLVIGSLVASLALVGCEAEQGPLEKAGESADNAIDNAKDAAGDAVEEGGDKLEEAADKVKKATDG